MSVISVQKIKKRMVAPLRTKTGLGYPPANFTTNDIECSHSVLKRLFDWNKITLGRGPASPTVHPPPGPTDMGVIMFFWDSSNRKMMFPSKILGSTLSF